MSRHTPPTYKTRNWPAYNEALKRRGSLTIWFDPEMTWDAAPTGKRGRQQSYSDAAIQTCLSMKVLFGMALRQTTGIVESWLGLILLHWAYQTSRPPCRRQSRILARKARSTCLLIAPASSLNVKANGMHVSMVALNGVSGGRSTLALIREHWNSEASSLHRCG